MCIKHLKLLLEFENEKQAVLEIRSHIGWYLKGVSGAKELKMDIYKLKTAKEIEKKLLDFKKMC